MGAGASTRRRRRTPPSVTEAELKHLAAYSYFDVDQLRALSQVFNVAVEAAEEDAAAVAQARGARSSQQRRGRAALCAGAEAPSAGVAPASEDGGSGGARRRGRSGKRPRRGHARVGSTDMDVGNAGPPPGAVAVAPDADGGGGDVGDTSAAGATRRASGTHSAMYAATSRSLAPPAPSPIVDGSARRGRRGQPLALPPTLDGQAAPRRPQRSLSGLPRAHFERLLPDAPEGAFDVFDTAGDGVVSFASFARVVSSCCAGPRDERLRAVFDMYSEWGRVSAEGLAQLTVDCDAVGHAMRQYLEMLALAPGAARTAAARDSAALRLEDDDDSDGTGDYSGGGHVSSGVVFVADADPRSEQLAEAAREQAVEAVERFGSRVRRVADGGGSSDIAGTLSAGLAETDDGSGAGAAAEGKRDGGADDDDRGSVGGAAHSTVVTVTVSSDPAVAGGGTAAGDDGAREARAAARKSRRTRSTAQSASGVQIDVVTGADGDGHFPDHDGEGMRHGSAVFGGATARTAAPSMSFAGFRAWAKATDFDVNGFLGRFDLIPSCDRELSEVCRLFDEHAAAGGMAVGSTMCVVSHRWWTAWCEYSQYGEPAQEDDGDGGDGDDAKDMDAEDGADRARSRGHSDSKQSGAAIDGEDGTDAGGVSSDATHAPTSGAAPEVPAISLTSGVAAAAGPGAAAARRPSLLVTPRTHTASAAQLNVGSARLAAADGAGHTAPATVAEEPLDATGETVVSPLVGGVGRERPGPIDNSDLCVAARSTAKDDGDTVTLAQGEAPVLQPNLVENDDFVLLPERVWLTLSRWYGGGPVIARRVIDGGDGTPVAELYPLHLTVRVVDDEGFASDDSVRVIAGRGQTWAAVLGAAAKQLGIDLPAPVAVDEVAAAAAEVDVGSDAKVDRAAGGVDGGDDEEDDDDGDADDESATALRMPGVRVHVEVPDRPAGVNGQGDGRGSAAAAGAATASASSVWHLLDTANVSERMEETGLVGGEALLIECASAAPHDDGSDGNVMAWPIKAVAKSERLLRQFEAGDRLDAKDQQGVWYSGVVVALEEVEGEPRVHVTFDEWPSKWDLWYPPDSGHLAPLRSQSRTLAEYKALKEARDREVAEKRKKRARRRGGMAMFGFGSDDPLGGGGGDDDDSDSDGGGGGAGGATGGAAGLPGVVGLRNLGNTCFLNSSLQCLLSTPALHTLAIGDWKRQVNKRNPLGSGGKLATEFCKFARIAWSGKASIVSPVKLKVAISRFAPQFSGFQQHDSQELLAFLLDGLHEDLNRVKTKPYTEALEGEGKPAAEAAAAAWALHMRRNDSVIVESFQGQLRSTICCPRPRCGKVSITFDPFMYLPLPLPTVTTRSTRVNVVRLASATMRARVAKERAGASSHVAVDDVAAAAAAATASTSPPPGARGAGPGAHPGLTSILTVDIAKDGTIGDVQAAISKHFPDTHPAAAAKQWIVCDVYQHKVYKTLPTRGRLSRMRDSDVLVAYEIAPHVEFVVQAVHYRQSSSPKFSLVPFGVPLLFSVTEGMTNGQLRRRVDAQVHAMAERYLAARNAQAQLEAHTHATGDPAAAAAAATAAAAASGGGAVARDDKAAQPSATAAVSPATESPARRLSRRLSSASGLRHPRRPQYSVRIVTQSIEDFGVRSRTHSNAGTGGGGSGDGGGGGGGGHDFVELPDDERELDLPADVFIAVVWAGGAGTHLARNDDGFGVPIADEDDDGDDDSEGGSGSTRGGIPLSSLLDSFVKEETLGRNDHWYCPKCKDHVPARKRFDLWAAPDTLVICIKRFVYTEVYRDKLNVPVDYPLEGLDLSPWLQSHYPPSPTPHPEDARATAENDAVAAAAAAVGATTSEGGRGDATPPPPPIYDLYGVSLHSGSLRFGHYTAVCRNPRDNKWYSFNDAYVREVPAAAARSTSAYVLFYKRRHVVGGGSGSGGAGSGGDDDAARVGPAPSGAVGSSDDALTAI